MEVENTNQTEIPKYPYGINFKNRKDPSKYIAEQNSKIIKALGKTPFSGNLIIEHIPSNAP